tara:strand:+ start:16502 stop:17482 length:981 start_codon:yes stop_codon:yes gene_type:complete
MQRCFDLAIKSHGYTYPNPLVGCVIVNDGKIISEGWHERAGEDHAEVVAINKIKRKKELKKSTLYVNLEPCCHTGKTPPCTDLIIESGIQKVVIGCLDPNIKVNGEGVRKLIENGIKVDVGICELRAKILNKRFFCYHEEKRPYIILKWAESKDGYLSSKKNSSNIGKVEYLTRMEDRILVHKWRKEEESILVGVQTLIDDNPKLTNRHHPGRSPVKIIFDPNDRADKNSDIFKSNNFIHITNKKLNIKKNSNKNLFLKKAIKFIYNLKISSILVEGGSFTIQEFINQEIFDEIRIFKTSKKLNAGTRAPLLPKNIKEKKIKIYNS